MNRRSFTGEADLQLLQGFNAADISILDTFPLMHGLRQMAAAGIEFATVAHFGHNKAARGLCQACGTKPWHLQHGYFKRIST